jgi:hypothetical protein
MADFWQKYRDPRWQEKRLRIMDRSGFECERCGSKDDTLNVHHKFYKKGASPWEYEDHELQCLCERCHEAQHEISETLKRHLARLDEGQLLHVLGYAIGVALLSDRSPYIKNIYPKAKELFDHFGWEINAGVCDAYGITEPESDGAILENGDLDGDRLWDAVRKNRG